MKKQYQTPNMQVTLLQSASIICTSQPQATAAKSNVGLDESISSGKGSGRANSRGGYDSGESDSWGLW